MKFIVVHNSFKLCSFQLGATNQQRNCLCEQSCSKESEMTMPMLIPNWCQNVTIPCSGSVVNTSLKCCKVSQFLIFYLLKSAFSDFITEKNDSPA